MGARGVFVTLLQEELARRGLKVPRPTISSAEFESRGVVSAFEALTSALNDGQPGPALPNPSGIGRGT
jgi:hypothetical protein